MPQKHSEKKLQRGILENMKEFVLEIGKDFLFVGSEYSLQTYEYIHDKKEASNE
ncbi:MAG: hypothetical protein EZS26_001526 [Candidatus Ordinivivax streblomastigis]|uniref:YhcG PDDEXK nuclease domain-containing protein n=1 Tax=Candidatus Ordinivivax streblomastigis TaxID=2540710 RepID=A0A5M8P1V1_9BACT|nr:MAG: hypothetical protein EZS26_001526 [Candidatus Ordinivivax streblomastigis]